MSAVTLWLKVILTGGLSVPGAPSSLGDAPDTAPSSAVRRWGALEISYLGFARAISRSRSASRQAPAFNVLVSPRPTLTAAGELAFLTLKHPDFAVRFGFYGFLEIESENETRGTRGGVFPIGDIRFWRGAFGFHGAVSLDALSERLCRGCLVEGALLFRHESEHYTGSNTGGPGTDYSDVAQVGDLFMPDLAFRIRANYLQMQARLQLRIFIPGASSYALAPGIDLQLRWFWASWLHPFVSGFAEYATGAEVGGFAYPDAYRLRALAGLALPSSLGDVMIYAAGHVGHRQGLAVYTEERVISLGVRLALGNP